MKKKNCLICGAALPDLRLTYCEPCGVGMYRVHRNTSAKVSRAISNGVLKHPSKLKCSDCGKPAQCYDHRDYSKPLDVAPVCSPCNVKRGPAINFGQFGITRQRAQQLGKEK